MARSATVLVTAAGTIVAQGVIKSLKLANAQSGRDVNYRIVAGDISAHAAGLYRSDLGLLLPEPDDPEYLPTIVDRCREQDISAIFVGSDEELAALAASAGRIRSETGAVVMTNTEDAVRIGSDKWETYRFLKGKGIPCPESAEAKERERFVGEFGFPLIVKPRQGHGSLNLFLAKSEEEIDDAIKRIAEAGGEAILQEYLEGDEYTSGVTSAPGGEVASSIAMRRVLKWGQTFKAYVDDFPEVRGTAERIAVALGSRGPLNVQSRLVKGGRSVTFEINPRISASCPIRAVAGVNEPDLLYRMFVLGERPARPEYRKLVCLRYLNEVYLPPESLGDAETSPIADGGGSFIPDYF